jgi:FixJ family two-component response regulator
VEKLKELGAEDFLEKPFDVTALSRKVQRLIGEP